MNYPRRVAIIGAGNVGNKLARLLLRADFIITGVSSRRLDSARNLANKIHAPIFTTRPEELIQESDILFLTTPDSQIESVSRQLAQCAPLQKERYVCHTSGLYTSDLLSAIKNRGAICFSFHPLMSIIQSESEEKDQPFFVALEGDETGIKCGKYIAKQIGATHFTIPSETKALYHAGAVIAANYLVTLFSTAVQVHEAAGIPAEKSERILMPLVLQTVQNIREKGVRDGLTGPIKRGDAETIRAHLLSFEEKMPELIDFYKILGKQTLPLVPDFQSMLQTLFT